MGLRHTISVMSDTWPSRVPSFRRRESVGAYLSGKQIGAQQDQADSREVFGAWL